MNEPKPKRNGVGLGKDSALTSIARSKKNNVVAKK